MIAITMAIGAITRGYRANNSIPIITAKKVDGETLAHAACLVFDGSAIQRAPKTKPTRVKAACHIGQSSFLGAIAKMVNAVPKHPKHRKPTFVRLISIFWSAIGDFDVQIQW